MSVSVRRFISHLALYSAALFASTACSKGPELVPLDLSAYNHTEQAISSYSVTIPNGIGGEAGHLDPGAGGGGMTCCVSVPMKWEPGMYVSVKKMTFEKGADQVHEQTVPLPEYDGRTAGSFNVHFLRGGAVKVFVTRLVLGHKDYPLRGKEAELKPGVPLKIIWQ